MELISIIVPIYNCEKFVENCIQSITNQTYSNIEILLLNDGSTDNSYDICQNFAAKDDRIKLFTHNNMGVAKTREKGLKLCQGKYVTFIDSDDTINDDFIEKMYEHLIKTKTRIVACNSMDGSNINRAITANKIISYDDFAKSFYDNKRYAFCIWGKLYEKSLFIDVEFPNMKYAEDTLLLQIIAQKTNKIALFDYVGYNYTLNPYGAMSNNKGNKQAKDVLKLYTYMYNTTKKGNLCSLSKKALASKKLLLAICSRKCDSKEKKEVINLIKNNPTGITSYFTGKNFLLIIFKLCPNLFWKLLLLIKKN